MSKSLKSDLSHSTWNKTENNSLRKSRQFEEKNGYSLACSHD